jgi:hypothetical protein
MPGIADETRRALALVEAGEIPAAAGILDRLIARHPGLGQLRAGRAAVAMLANDPDLALVHLEAAAVQGFPVAEASADPLFAPLAGAPALAALAARPAPEPPPAPLPAPIVAGVARVAAANTAWNPATERLEPRFDRLPARKPRSCPRAPEPPPPTCCASMSGAAGPPGNGATFTTTATAAIPACVPRPIPSSRT